MDRPVPGGMAWARLGGTWRATVDLLSDPDRYTARHRRARFLLTGVALCGVCGATVNAGGTTGQATASTAVSVVRPCPRAAAPVENWVSEVVIARLSREDAAELLHDDKRPDLEALRREATAKRARLNAMLPSSRTAS